MSTHTLALVLTSRLNQDGMFREMELGPFFAIQQSVSIISIVIVALVAVIAFPLLEGYYTKGIQQQTLIQRVSLIVGIQLILLGIVQFLTRLIAELSIPIEAYLVLIGGIALVVLSKKVLRQNAKDSSISDTSN